MTIAPFKIREGEGHACLETARLLFGEPTEISYKGTPDRTTMHWHFYEDGLRIGMQMTHTIGTDRMEVSHTAETLNPDHTMCGRYMPGSSYGKLKKFVDAVGKPWTEWTHDEIMESPMWVCLYREAGNAPSDAMENMMHMLSFDTPGDKWVKRYFGKGKR